MIRLILRVVVGVLLVGAVWLYTVRGEALMLDLRTVFCF
jgi:hypothetical protein